MPRHRRIAARKQIKTASASSRNPPSSPKRTSSTGVRPRATRSAVSVTPNTASLLEESQETLRKLPQDKALTGGNLSPSFQAITEACCKLLRVERAGVWLFTDHRAHSLCAQGRNRQDFSSGCTAHITKPVKKTTLLEILQAHQKRAA